MLAFAPTRRKLGWTLVGLLVLPACLLLRQIPHTWDVFDLRLLGRDVLFAFLGVPIRFLDAVTHSAFASKSEAFLVFPTVTQVAFALCVDALFFYVVACGIVRWRERRLGKKAARNAAGAR